MSGQIEDEEVIGCLKLLLGGFKELSS